MKITVDIPDDLVESTVRDMVSNFPDCSMSLACTKWKYDEFVFAFYDHETGEKHQPTKEEWINAFALIYTPAWPAGCQQPPAAPSPEELENWLCRCDATDFDAFAQLAIFGEVIYG